MASTNAPLTHADGRVVCDRCVVADTFFTRARGLLGRRALPPGEGLLLKPAGSIHTLFMRFPIDAVFLDRDLRVVGTAAHVRPWRLAMRRSARRVLELAAGETERRAILRGDRLVLGDADGGIADRRQEDHAIRA